MSDELIAWLSQELDQRNMSYRELGNQARISFTLISKVLSGKTKASPDFCIKIAQALDESPEKLLRLAGHIPPPSDAGTSDQILEDLIDISKKMTPEERQDVLDYARYRYQKRTP